MNCPVNLVQRRTEKTLPFSIKRCEELSMVHKVVEAHIESDTFRYITSYSISYACRDIVPPILPAPQFDVV